MQGEIEYGDLLPGQIWQFLDEPWYLEAETIRRALPLVYMVKYVASRDPDRGRACEAAEYPASYVKVCQESPRSSLGSRCGDPKFHAPMFGIAPFELELVKDVQGTWASAWPVESENRPLRLKRGCSENLGRILR